MSKNIRNLKFWCQPVLPLTYDDSLSYYETLAKVVSKVNEVIAFTEGILESANNYTDSQVDGLRAVLESEIAELRSDIDVFKREVYAYIDEHQNEFEEHMLDLFEAQREAIESEFATLSDTVNNTLATLSSQIALLREYVNAEDDEIRRSILQYHEQAKQYVDEQVEILEQEIQAIVLESVTRVIDPCDLEEKSLQNCIDNMYYNLRSWAFTCRQFDMLGITCGEYDAISPSAWTYDYLGKWVCWQKPEIFKYINAMYEKLQKAFEDVYRLIDERTITHSAWTGKMDKLINITDSAIMEIRTDALTSELYDSLLLSCTDYSEYELTAYEYDWHGLSKLIHPDEQEFSEFALLEYRSAFATNKLLDMITNSVDNVEVVNEVLTITTSPFDGEPYDVQGIISDTVAHLGYQVYQNIVAINEIIEKTKYQFTYDSVAERLDISPIGVNKIDENISTNFSVIASQIIAVRNALGRLEDYYTYLLSINDEVFNIVGTQLIAQG